MEKKFMYELPIFDDWLTKKSDEVISKVNRETITNEETLILILKSQNEYFKKLDQRIEYEFVKAKNDLIASQQEQNLIFENKFLALEEVFDFKNKSFEDRTVARFDVIDERFDSIDTKFQAVDTKFQAVDTRFQAVDKRFQAIEERIDRLEKRFDELERKVDSHFLWTIGFMTAGFSGIFLKLFFG